ncbi:MAG: hypothetical protein JXA99_01970 [Candidatus Lokiarchaeota archaeon]|nr:hypothetical protein [Candidatus Lokiarchaeota archaeon]
MNHILEFKKYNFCDGCQYFEMDLSKSYMYPAYENPIYSLVYKQTVEELEFISPKEYIYKIALGFGNLSYDDALLPVSDKLVNKYAEDMKNGDKFPIGYYTDGSSAQEGRHRALALMKLGVEIMPVIKRTNVSKKYIQLEVELIKDFTREELNNYYISKGYNGITDLDWRELQSYLKYPERY